MTQENAPADPFEAFLKGGFRSFEDGEANDFSWTKGFAQKEELGWLTLEKIHQNNNRRWLKTYGWVLVTMTIVFSSVYVIAFLVISVHYLSPWHWLTNEQIDKIQSILFSGGVGAIVSTIVRTQIAKAR